MEKNYSVEDKLSVIYQLVRSQQLEIDTLKREVSELKSKDTIGMFYTGSNNTQSVSSNATTKPAKYKRITSHLQELQAMYNKEDGEWEINFIQGILDFSGQTVTEKQYEVLQTISQKVEFTKELVTIR